MGSNGHGILLLQDLEESDVEYEPQYSNNNTVNSFLYNSDIKGGSKGTLKANTDHLLVPSPTNQMFNGHVSNINGFTNFPRRRNSISAEPPLVLLHGNNSKDIERFNHQHDSSGYHSSMSLQVPSQPINNAITVAPSRNSLLEPNVFQGGRSHSNHHHHHHKKHHHRKHKGRSRSPNNNGNNNTTPDNLEQPGSILTKIDNSILKNFGDWSNVEDDGFRSRLLNNNNNNSSDKNSSSNCKFNGGKNTPYYIPKKGPAEDELLLYNNDFKHIGINNGQLSLPKLYKNYDTVVTHTKKILNDTSFHIALSKDNNDPNSILSEAKRTLSQLK